MPQRFLLILFFWHDFLIFGTIFSTKFYFWHAINPYHQRSYKVHHFCRCKLLVSKGLRSAGQAIFSKFLFLNALWHLKTNVIGKFAVLAGVYIECPLLLSKGEKARVV